jgi:hypothetical protein
MKTVMLAGCVVGLLSADADAQTTYHPWCMHGLINGAVSCSFDSRAQCDESARGGGGICTENPAPAPPPEAAAAEAPATPTVTVIAPGGRKLGTDPDARIRSYMQREGQTGTSNR